VANAIVDVAQVKAFKTQSGNTRYVLVDEQRREYSTFREEIARSAVAAEGHRARITFHEEQRGRFTNVYLDSVDVLDSGDEPREAAGGAPLEEAAWKSAIDAAPWLLGGEPEEPVPPDELFERLQPFKERVAEDIRASAGDEDD
jgi:hypothetical protein